MASACLRFATAASAARHSAICTSPSPETHDQLVLGASHPCLKRKIVADRASVAWSIKNDWLSPQK
jgi:hypothetical protein